MQQILVIYNCDSKPMGGGQFSTTRGLFAGGRILHQQVNTIEYITIASTANSQDFGDLTSKWGMSAGFQVELEVFRRIWSLKH